VPRRHPELLDVPPGTFFRDVSFRPLRVVPIRVCHFVHRTILAGEIGIASGECPLTGYELVHFIASTQGPEGLWPITATNLFLCDEDTPCRLCLNFLEAERRCSRVFRKEF
jgi:hypothetical protein